MSMMQDPSQGVAQPLQNHVHLISGHRFPLVASMSIEQAYRYLLDAPQIVKQLAPMSWTYVQAPQDGTLWLEWLPNKNDPRFPSDGYVWGDPETAYRQDFGGYTIETLVHTVGYRPQYDHMASHARTRYHLIAKNPSVNAAPPDPSLWIVHYHQADQQRMLPTNQVPFSPQMKQIIQERRWLESQGRLEKKDFMLHDREHWPTIHVPAVSHMQQPQMQQPGFYGANPMGPPMGHVRQQPPGWPQPPPQKRQRQHAPSVMPGSNDGVPDTSIEDEENTALGDFFDHLTPRDISMARYMQHHRWMEEVFSSPYATSQIVPTDLGLGLMGELRGLTDGILDPPSTDFTDSSSDKPMKRKDAQAFTNLKKEQIDEFNKRVEKHLEEGQAEIERMKAEHAAKMQEWKKTKVLMQAEKRLRYATWEGHEDAVPGFRLEETVMDGHAEDGAARETVEDVVNEVESLLGVKITSHKEATLVEKGGLEKEEEPVREETVQDREEEQLRLTEMEEQPAVGAATEPVMYHQDPAPPAPTATSGMSILPNAAGSLAVPDLLTGQQQQQQQMQPEDGGEAAERELEDQPGDDMAAMDMNDTSLMEAIDLDVDDSNLTFVESALGGTEDEVSAMPDPSKPLAQAPIEQQSQARMAADNTEEAASSATFGASEAQQRQQRQPGLVQHPSITEAGALAGDSGLGKTNPMTGGAADLGNADDVDDDDDNNMFNDSAFDDLTNVGDDGDGELIDFEGGEMAMDNSAFGDALHGMETAGTAEDDDDDDEHGVGGATGEGQHGAGAGS